VRRVCPVCAAPDEADPRELELFGITPDQARGLRVGRGCSACGLSGCRGRSGVYEMMRVTPRLRSLIACGATPVELAIAARSEGLDPMWRDGVAKALAGETTLAEASRVRADEPAALDNEVEAAA